MTLWLKLVIMIILIVIIGTFIDNPLYRRLIDEESDDDDDHRQKRIWCIITYPSSLETYNYIIHIFNFIGPFLINLISSVILRTKKSGYLSNVHRERSYKEILQEQFRQNRLRISADTICLFCPR